MPSQKNNPDTTLFEGFNKNGERIRILVNHSDKAKQPQNARIILPDGTSTPLQEGEEHFLYLENQTLPCIYTMHEGELFSIAFNDNKDSILLRGTHNSTQNAYTYPLITESSWIKKNSIQRYIQVLNENGLEQAYTITDDKMSIKVLQDKYPYSNYASNGGEHLSRLQKDIIATTMRYYFEPVDLHDLELCQFYQQLLARVIAGTVEDTKVDDQEMEKLSLLGSARALRHMLAPSSINQLLFLEKDVPPPTIGAVLDYVRWLIHIQMSRVSQIAPPSDLSSQPLNIDEATAKTTIGNLATQRPNNFYALTWSAQQHRISLILNKFIRVGTGLLHEAFDNEYNDDDLRATLTLLNNAHHSRSDLSDTDIDLLTITSIRLRHSLISMGTTAPDKLDRAEQDQMNYLRSHLVLIMDYSVLTTPDRWEIFKALDILSAQRIIPGFWFMQYSKETLDEVARLLRIIITTEEIKDSCSSLDETLIFYFITRKTMFEEMQSTYEGIITTEAAIQTAVKNSITQFEKILQIIDGEYAALQQFYNKNTREKILFLSNLPLSPFTVQCVKAIALLPPNLQSYYLTHLTPAHLSATDRRGSLQLSEISIMLKLLDERHQIVFLERYHHDITLLLIGTQIQIDNNLSFFLSSIKTDEVLFLSIIPILMPSVVDNEREGLLLERIISRLEKKNGSTEYLIALFENMPLTATAKKTIFDCMEEHRSPTHLIPRMINRFSDDFLQRIIVSDKDFAVFLKNIAGKEKAHFLTRMNTLVGLNTFVKDGTISEELFQGLIANLSTNVLETIPADFMKTMLCTEKRVYDLLFHITVAKKYEVFDYLDTTFHIADQITDPLPFLKQMDFRSTIPFLERCGTKKVASIENLVAYLEVIAPEDHIDFINLLRDNFQRIINADAAQAAGYLMRVLACSKPTLWYEILRRSQVNIDDFIAQGHLARFIAHLPTLSQIIATFNDLKDTIEAVPSEKRLVFFDTLASSLNVVPLLASAQGPAKTRDNDQLQPNPDFIALFADNDQRVVARIYYYQQWSGQKNWNNNADLQENLRTILLPKNTKSLSWFLPPPDRRIERALLTEIETASKKDPTNVNVVAILEKGLAEISRKKTPNDFYFHNKEMRLMYCIECINNQAAAMINEQQQQANMTSFESGMSSHK